MCLNCLDLSCYADKCDPLKAKTLQISFAEQTINKTCTLAHNLYCTQMDNNGNNFTELHKVAQNYHFCQCILLNTECSWLVSTSTRWWKNVVFVQTFYNALSWMRVKTMFWSIQPHQYSECKLWKHENWDFTIFELKNEEITTVQQMQALKTICRGRWPASFYNAQTWEEVTGLRVKLNIPPLPLLFTRQ